MTPGTKMKQLQWDKVPQTAVAKTLWQADTPDKEKEWLNKLKDEGILRQMEEDFHAKQTVINLMARQKKAELKSVLDPTTKKHVEIIIKLHNDLSPEQIAAKIRNFDPKFCQLAFLKEMKPFLPSPEQIGKLNVYRNASEDELSELHSSDRLMVQLIKIDRLGQRWDCMLYKANFEEQVTLLEEGARKLYEASESLLGAENFKEVMRLILLIGNYMNNTGHKGGAFGFKVSSINKLVDTKSVNNTTLLHFLERTIHKEFPAMETFLDELAKPAEAYRVNLQELRKGLGELRTGLKTIRNELEQYFNTVEAKEADNAYGKRMWRFHAEATERLAELGDDVTLADTKFSDVLKHYGEDEKNMQSSDFFGIYKTFVTSYKRCQNDNREIDKEKEAQIRREQATKEFQAARAEAAAARAAEGEGDASLDALLENLKNGPIVRRSKKRTPGITPETSPQPADNPDAPAAKAMDMLAALKTGGLGAFVPPSPRSERLGSGRRRIRPSGLSISSSAADLEDSESVSSAGHSRHGTRSTIFEEELPTPNGEASET